MDQQNKTEKRELASITRDLYKDQVDKMKKIHKATGVPVVVQMRKALDAYLGLPEKPNK